MKYINSYVLLALTAVLILFNTINTAFGAGVTAEIVDIPDNNKSGQVLFKNPTDAKFKVAKKKDKISENGIIATGKDSKATVDIIINFGSSKSFLRVSNNTFLKLSPYEDKIQVALGKGKVLVQNQSNAHKVNVSLGNYVAASEGTTFSAELNENSKDSSDINSNIDVLEGKVKFWNPDQTSAKPEYVLPGEKFRLNFRLNKTAMARKNNTIAALDQSLNDLKGKNVFSNDQIARMSQCLNRMSSSGMTVRQQNRQNFTIDLNNTFYNRRNMIKENLQKIDENRIMQRKGILKQNNEAIRKGIAQRIENRFKNNQLMTPGNNQIQPSKNPTGQEGIPTKGATDNQNRLNQPNKGQMNGSGMENQGNNSSKNQINQMNGQGKSNQNNSMLPPPQKWKVNQPGIDNKTNSNNTISQPSRNEGSNIKRPKKYSRDELNTFNQKTNSMSKNSNAKNANMSQGQIPPMDAGPKPPPMDAGPLPPPMDAGPLPPPVNVKQKPPMAKPMAVPGSAPPGT